MQTDNLMTSLMKKLYTTLTDGNDDFDPRNAEDRFITWCLPGIPFDVEDLRFAHQGFTGKGDTPEEKGADTAQLSRQANQFARLVDFVPSVTGVFDDKQQLVAFHRNESALSRIYERVLRQSQVADIPLTDEEKTKLQNIRKVLYQEREVEIIDENTFEMKKQTIMEDGPLLQVYKAKQTLYEEARGEFKAAQTAANAAATPEAVLFFQEMGQTLAKRMNDAMSDWETAGRKNQVDRMREFVDDVTSRSLLLWKADVEDRFDISKKLDIASGTEYLYTTLIPGRFAATDAGWAQFSFSESETSAYEKHKLTRFQVGGSLGFGSLSLSGQVQGSNKEDITIKDVSNFSMSFKVAQIPLSRAWFDPSFLESRAWRLHKDAQLDLGGDFLSDGKIPPTGALPAYPTSVIFVRDITINFDEMHDKSHEIHKHLKANGKFGFKGFNLGGSYERDTKTKEQKSSFTKEGYTVDGLQIIGFRCHLLRKSPNPSEDIPDSSFV